MTRKKRIIISILAILATLTFGFIGGLGLLFTGVDNGDTASGNDIMIYGLVLLLLVSVCFITIIKVVKTKE